MSWRVVKCVLEHHDQKIRGSDLLALVYLANHARADDGSGAWPSQRRLADKTGLHRATVQRVLSRLVDAGAVEVEQRPGRTHRFRVRMCAVCLPSPSASQRGTRTNPPAAESDRDVAQSDRGGRTVRHEPLSIPPTEPPSNAVSASPPVDNPPSAPPAGSEQEHSARNRKAAFIQRRVEQIRREQGDRAAAAYQAAVTRNDVRDERAAELQRLSSGETPDGYAGYVPAWAIDTWRTLHPVADSEQEGQVG